MSFPEQKVCELLDYDTPLRYRNATGLILHSYVIVHTNVYAFKLSADRGFQAGNCFEIPSE